MIGPVMIGCGIIGGTGTGVIDNGALNPKSDVKCWFLASISAAVGVEILNDPDDEW
jgi:hypothetical protein